MTTSPRPRRGLRTGRALLLALSISIVTAGVTAWITGSPALAAATAGLILVAFVALPIALLRGGWRVAGAVGGLVAFVGLGLVAIRLRYGGGEPYPDLRTPPRFAAAALEPVVSLPFPPGNVAITPGGRLFFNYHPFAQAQRFAPATMFELVDGVPRPFPDAAFQARYQGVFGMTVDGQNRLWLVEPASLDHARTRLLAFDLGTGALVHEHWFAPGEARFAQDFRVAPDGRTIYLADTGLFQWLPASLIVLDVASGKSRRVLVDDPSTRPQDWIVHTPFGLHKMGYGLVTWSVGVDGIALSPDGAWLYFGAMCHQRLYKVPTAALRDPAMSSAALSRQVVAVGPKPLSDGITLDGDGILITDIEHGGLARLSPGGALETVVSSPAVIWADGVVVAPSGDVIFTDSAIPAYIDPLARPPARARLDAAAPYHIYRLRGAALAR